MDYTYDLKIPKERIPILIGPSGKIKKEIEKATNTSIQVDSKEGEVLITSEEGIHIYIAKEIIRAIARGFNPDIAKLLLNQDYSFELINLAEYTKSKEQMKRLKSRIIGSEGKARRTMESLTDTSISVFGKTIGIIGEIEETTTARQAIESLIGGSTHATVYRFLEKQKRYTKEAKALGKNLDL